MRSGFQHSFPTARQRLAFRPEIHRNCKFARHGRAAGPVRGHTRDHELLHVRIKLGYPRVGQRLPPPPTFPLSGRKLQRVVGAASLARACRREFVDGPFNCRQRSFGWSTLGLSGLWVISNWHSHVMCHEEKKEKKKKDKKNFKEIMLSPDKEKV